MIPFHMDAGAGRRLPFRRGLSVMLLGLFASLLSAQDYTIKAVPPVFEKDARTSFLADFSQGKLTALNANGDAAIAAANPVFDPKGGLKGNFSIAGDKNFNPASWTAEVILRVPKESKGNFTFFQWNSGPIQFSGTIGGGHGVGFRLYVPRGGGVAREFQYLAMTGGNGAALDSDAPGEWVYVAFGFSALEQRAWMMVRDLKGNVLKNIIQYAGSSGPLSDELKNMSAEEREAAVRQGWQQVAGMLSNNAPATISVGSDSMEIRQLRLSNVYRRDIVEPQLGAPLQASGALSWANRISTQAKSRNVSRSLGFSPRRQMAMTVQESYIPLGPGARLEIPLNNLSPSLYSLYLFGCIDPQGRKELARVWKPCPLSFEIRDKAGKKIAPGKLLLKQSFDIRRLQGFHFHIEAPGDYTAVLTLDPKAQERPELVAVSLCDQLKDLPDVAIKQSQNLEKNEAGPPILLSSLTPDRQKRDEMIWQALPPLNIHWQVHAQVAPFRDPPPSVKLPAWQTRAFAGEPAHRSARLAVAPLDFLNADTQEVFPHAKIVASEPWPGNFPDDGTGIFFSQKDYPALKHDLYLSPRANLLGQRVQVYLGLLGTWDVRGASVVNKYFQQGDPEIGHDAAMMLVRLAYDWPAVEMNLHEQRLCTHAPDFEFNTDWSSGRNGKFFYEGWSGGTAVDLMKDYDMLFPYIQSNQVLADAVGRFIPWVKKPQDVIRLLDRYLVFGSVRDFNRGQIRAAPVEDVAAIVLGPHPKSESLFDLTRAHVEIYPYEGTFEDLYATALSRCGSYYIASFMCYAFGDAGGLVIKADLLRKAREAGVKLPMDLSDVQRFPKVRAAADFMIDMFFAGGFPAMIGDASGGTHTAPQAAAKSLGAAREASQAAFNLDGDPRHAWLLANLHNSKDPKVIQAATNVANPLLHGVSRVVPDYLAILEERSEATNVLEKTALTMRLGCGQGHAHQDFLDLNLFGMGAPLAVDLACRNEGGNWSRPGAAASFLHNHAMACPEENPYKGSQSGEPWLRAFEPPLVRGRYENQSGAEKLERDTILVEDGDLNRFYVMDLQRLTGGGFHTWCFHGCESADLKLNVPMEAKTVRWIDRTLAGTHKAGPGAEVLEGVWTMTREKKEFQHTFDRGGVIQTVACEPTVLGALYDGSNQPPIHVRAQLLGRARDTVLQGNPYSQSYAYCFPFLWVQHAAESSNSVSVYPAVYDWYRGDQTVVQSAELLRKDGPLVVKVTTRGGQTDVFSLEGEALAVVSRDDRGLRWARLSGGKELKDGDLEIKLQLDKYVTTVAAIDYDKRTLVTSAPLPANPRVTIGSAGNHRFLDLKGSGTLFTFKDDLLIQEGAIQKTEIKGADEVELASEPHVFHANNGNRKMAGFTVTIKGTEWQFRGGRVIRRPAGEALAPEIFRETSDGGFRKTRIYEIGLGDTVELLADVDIRRSPKGFKIRANVAGEATIKGRKARF